MCIRRIDSVPSEHATAKQCVSSTKQRAVMLDTSWWTRRGLEEMLRSRRALSQTRMQLSRCEVTKKIWSGEEARWSTGELASRNVNGDDSAVEAFAREGTDVRLAEALRRLLTAAGLMRGPKSCADSLRLSR